MALISKLFINKRGLDKLKNNLKGKANELLSRTFDQHVTLAVTGLSRSGKTAFITSLVNQLINEGNGTKLSFFDPVHNGTFIAAKRVPQKHFHVPRFDYDAAISALTAEQPNWPEPTHGISELRLSIRYQPKSSILKYATDMATLTLDITDYPGEWLLDLPMLKQTYQQWSQQTYDLMTRAPRAELSKSFLAKLALIDPLASASEELLGELAQEYTALLYTFRYDLGLSVIQPGRFILPGELAGAPILEFFPFPALASIDGNAYQNAPDDSFVGMLRSRYLEYKEQVVRKFYREHFLRFDRQIVLADCLTPLNKGRESFADLELAMSMILQSYSYGKSGLFSRLFSPKIDKLLFCATKADHVTPEQHAPMVALLNQLIHQNKHHISYEAVQIKTLAIAAVKATTSGVSKYKGADIPVIQGQRLAQREGKGATEVFGQKITVFPGAVPNQLPQENYWRSNTFNFIAFAPLSDLTKHQCLPHIRMDQVLQFLLADKMI
ncbi:MULTISPECIES: YcjX family protein [Colwellia]|uniref:ATP-binding protein n=1 Tax=Colwellia marinimaniae TaxID=1513592 RepID=A0ABQ0MZ85_9GAMM|nr:MULTISPECIES: YcjX family protein [Colwellia]GAW97655.1 ATP-binding protein [Colwellia marinimaniae]